MLIVFVFLDRFRLKYTEELVKGTIKKLTQGMVEHNKAMTAAKTEEEKAKIVIFTLLFLLLMKLLPCSFPILANTGRKLRSRIPQPAYGSATIFLL